MHYYKSDMKIRLVGLKDEDGVIVNGATVKAYLFEETPLHLNTGPAVAALQNVKPNAHVVNTLAFTAGGTSEILAGNLIEQIGGGGATALVTKVNVTSGSWEGDDAVGTLELANQLGDFESGTIKVGSTTNEKQTLTIAGSPTGGSFKLSFEGQETAAIDFNSATHHPTAAEIEAALELLSTCPVVACTGGPLDTVPIVVEFQGALIGKDVDLLVLSANSLTGGSTPTVGIAETVKGSGYVAATAADSDKGGTFTITFGIETTAAIAGNAPLADIKAALEALEGIGTVTLTGEPLDVTPLRNGFYVKWADTVGDAPLLSADVSSLSGVTSISVTEITKGHLLGVAIDDTDGKLGLPIEGHQITSHQFVWFCGSRNHDGIYNVLSTARNKIVIDTTYAEEVYTGKEEIFAGIEGGNALVLSEDGSTGNYEGALPDDLKKYIRGERHILMVEAIKGASRLIVVDVAVAGFYTGI